MQLPIFDPSSTTLTERSIFIIYFAMLNGPLHSQHIPMICKKEYFTESFSESRQIREVSA